MSEVQNKQFEKKKKNQWAFCLAVLICGIWQGGLCGAYGQAGPIWGL